MKKKILVSYVLIGGLVNHAFASKGYANDGLEFLAVIAGFLLILAGIMEGIDYLHRNWHELLHRAETFLKNLFHHIGT
jgi:hypothetical protein